MILFNSLLIISTVTLLLLFWFKTNFVIVYGQLFRLNKLLKLDLYRDKKNMNVNLTYSQFLAITYNNFFVRLLSCVVCLATWISIITSIIFYLLYLDKFILFAIPIYSVFSLIIYLNIIKKL